MIRKCGILKRTSAHLYHAALALYRNAEKADDAGPVAFRRANSLSDPIEVRFVGVWDTVGSLGIPLRGLRWLTRQNVQFHDTELSKSIRCAYQALAIDEHRAPFRPTLWLNKAKEGQMVGQVWFCGAHTDVGGGYADRGLADITLDWMINKAVAAGLVMDPAVLKAYPVRLSCDAPLHDSQRGWYRWSRPIERLVGIDASPLDGPPSPTPPLDPTQSLHESVRQRWDCDASYRPAALRRYFALMGDERGGTSER